MTNMLQIPILLAIARLNNSAYGMAIIDDIKEKYEREVTVGSVYMTLKRMEQDKLIRSRLGEITKVRGGRRKRTYFLESKGRHYLRDHYTSVSNIWHDLEHYLAEHRFI